MSTCNDHYQREANRARRDAYYQKLVHLPGYSYARFQAQWCKGLEVQRQWREFWAQLEARRALRRMLLRDGGAV